VSFVIDARPSDAVALAVRHSAPVFLDAAIFDETSVETSIVSQPTGSSIDATTQQMAQILNDIHDFAENVQPGDFQ